jgi:prepilin-type N-terminal cleavage/methylation domain-containing protein
MRPPRSRGFNLLEMAMVLAIIGEVVSDALQSWRSAPL